ncbi:MAG: response regulator [Paludibacter sp.]
MTEQNFQTVLFIDDDSSIYLISLKLAAEAAGFELFATDNVLDGINYLKNYTEIVSAIILDINFPRGEMQGLEALQKIKILQPELPVIMLTDSDTAADIDMVVECMRKGAYNYIGKRTLNPVYLFQVVEKAVGESKLQERFRVRNNVPDKSHRFFTVKTKCEFGRYSRSGIFGFELISVNKADDDREAANLEKLAIQWHENLLKSISFVYRNELQINLKYIGNKNKIKCRIIFTVFATDETGLDKIIDNIQHDIHVFFSASKIEDTHPYIFEEMSEPDYLRNANDYSDNNKHIVFFRRPLKVKKTNDIGFIAIEKTISEDQEKNIPDELFPIPVKYQYDSEIFKALLNQNEYAEIDVQLMPKQLLIDEIDLIRKVINDTKLLDLDVLNFEQRIYYANYLKKFITRTNDKFLISVILKRTSPNWEQHLKTGIQNYFFGPNVDVSYQLREHDNLQRFCTSKIIVANQLPFYYSAEEAIQIFRLPIPSLSELSGIKQQSHKFHSHPDNLSEDGMLLGIKKLINSDKDIRIDKESLARHLYIMGQTGTGKSTMLKTMISDCLDKNYGFTIIDPHGDLYDQVLKLIPKNKKNRMFLLDTSDAENSIKLNPLLYDENMPQAKSLVINEVLRAFYSLYDKRDVGGPMFEMYFKNGLLLIMDEKVEERYGKSTLENLLTLFYDEEYRKERLLICEDKNVTDFFRIAQARFGENNFESMAFYMTSKLTRFVEDYYLAPILTSKTNNVDFRSLIDNGNILLVKMDKGLIGADNASLLGQLILSKLFLAGMSRANISIEERKPHYIFIDEFQNFVKGDVGTALSEVRKYGLNLILANQTLGQLDEYIFQSLIGNVGSLIFFRPGVNDYEKLKYYIEPDFKREDVLKLPNFNCIARLMINNVPSDPFVFQTKL